MNRIQFLLPALAVTCLAAQADTFSWQPNISQPNPSVDVTQSYQFTTLSFYAPGIEGVTISDVMPTWTDEDDNVVTAASGEQNPWGWDPTQFEYKFNIEDFKGNGEYILTFPEGMLTNAAGQLSAKVQIPYSFNVPELAGAMFDDFQVLSISPDLNAPQAIWDNQLLTISTNHNDAIGMTMLTITDLTENEVVCVSSNYATGRVPGSNSDISWNVAGVRKFYEGHNYKAEITFYNGRDLHGEMGELTAIVDRVYYEFEGKVEGYKYSSVSLLSVSPEPMTMISTPEEAVLTYVFSAPVTVYQAETPLGSSGKQIYSESYLSSNEDKTVWTLNLSSSPFMNNVDSSVVINIYVRDMDGYQLKGNEGSESDSCFQYTWECQLGAFPIVVVSPAEGQTVDVLDKVVVKAANEKQLSWSWNGKATVCSSDGELIGTLVYDNSDINNHSVKEISFTQWVTSDGATEPILLTEKGDYEISFDHGCFIVGEQYDSKISHSLTSGFSLSGEGIQGSVDSIGGSNGSDSLCVVDVFGRIVLRNAAKNQIDALPKGIYIINGKKTVVK